jgi:hypothetical protein
MRRKTGAHACIDSQLFGFHARLRQAAGKKEKARMSILAFFYESGYPFQHADER